MALFYLKAIGEFDAAVREWEANPEANKTWTNIKSFISTEYAKENKQNKLTAKQFKANAMKEQAKATEELINALMENHTHQIEALIRSTTEAMKEMMTLVKLVNKTPPMQTMGQMKRKQSGKKNRTNTKTHLYANIATENTQTNRKANAGNSNPMQNPAQPGRDLPKAPEGVRGQQ
jgi:hypothetical protein